MPQIFLKTESPSHCVSQILLLKNDWIVYNIESNQCCVFGVDLSMIIVVVTDYYDFVIWWRLHLLSHHQWMNGYYVPSMVIICCGLASGARNRWNDSSFLAPAVIFCCLLFQENLLLLRLKLQLILIFCRPVYHHDVFCCCWFDYDTTATATATATHSLCWCWWNTNIVVV